MRTRLIRTAFYKFLCFIGSIWIVTSIILLIFKPKRFPESKENNSATRVDSFSKLKLSDEILELHRRLNLTNPGHMGLPVLLPDNLNSEFVQIVNQSMEVYRINEFVSTLVPLDRELPDIRSDYCKQMKYSENLPKASIIMVFHNEAPSMILRTVYSVLNRSPAHLIVEVLLIDDFSTFGEFEQTKKVF